MKHDKLLHVEGDLGGFDGIGAAVAELGEANQEASLGEQTQMGVLEGQS